MTTHILQETNGYVWKAVLNQTQIDQNNNKYYYIQLLQADSDSNQYYVWNRWGRVGYDGQNKLMNFRDLSQAKREFCKKFSDKTGGQEWQGQNPSTPYQMVKGKYYPLAIDEEDDGDERQAPPGI